MFLQCSFPPSFFYPNHHYRCCWWWSTCYLNVRISHIFFDRYIVLLFIIICLISQMHLGFPKQDHTTHSLYIYIHIFFSFRLKNNSHTTTIPAAKRTQQSRLLIEGNRYCSTMQVNVIKIGSLLSKSLG